MKDIDDLYKEHERKQEQLLKLSKKARRYPKHGPRRQALEQIITMVHVEVRMLEWVIDEKIKPVEQMSEETIKENGAWLK